jgi:hypothetical protein
VTQEETVENEGFMTDKQPMMETEDSGR